MNYYSTQKLDQLWHEESKPKLVIEIKPIKKQRLETIEHSYACSVKEESGYKFFRMINGKKEEILNHPFPEKPHPKFESFLKIGQNYVKEYSKKTKIIKTDYSYVKKLGFKITRKEAPEEDFLNTRIEYVYFLTPINSPYEDCLRIPREDNVEFDEGNQRIILNGKNVAKEFSGWLSFKKEKSKEEKKLTISDIKNENDLREWNKQRYYSLFSNKYNQEKIFIKKIPEVIIGITERNEICCIPNTKDAPVIAISGARGYGKTFLENSLECGFYNKYNYDIFNFNDIKGDTQTRCLPWDKEHKFYKDLIVFKEPTFRLPYVYLTPILHGLTNEEIFYKNEVGFTVSLPFKELMLDSSNLISYNPEWKPSPRAQKYIKDLIEDEKGKERKDGLMSIKDLNDLDNKLKERITGSGLVNLRGAIYRTVKDLWNRDVLDKTSKIASKWILKKGETEQELYPWNACLKARLIPAFITKRIRNEPLFPMWIKFLLESVFNFANGKDYKRYLMLCGDELTQILQTKGTLSILNKAIAEGRTEKIGVIQCVQYRDYIPDAIRQNISHSFAFKTTSEKDRTVLRRDLTDTEVEDLRQLNRFQCYAFGDFILYDMNGNKYSNDGEAVKIVKTKPPNVQNYGVT